jgi:hypothetical protein
MRRERIRGSAGASLMMIGARKGAKERIAAWRADESGAARADRVVLVFGVVAVTALLAYSMIGREAPATVAGSEGTPAAGSAGTPGQAAPDPAAPERRVVSASGRAAPEPPQAEGRSTGPAAMSASYMDRFEPRFSNEQAILSAQTERANAANDAARAAAEEEAARAASEAAPAGSEPSATAEAAPDGS